MTDEQINIAIAEECEWNFDWKRGWKHIARDPKGEYHETCPYYCTDLNAIQEAARYRFRTDASKAEYEYRLRVVLANGRPAFKVSGWELMQASARQYSEAFLRTLGKWPTA